MPLLIINHETNEWEQITKEQKKEMPLEEQEKVLSMPNKLKKKLDFALSQQDKDNDVVGLVCGDEGSGKSSLAGNIMRYISKDRFDPRKDMIGADYEDGIEKITNRKQTGWLMFDEGNVFFLSTEIMKKEQRELHKVFSIFRQKNLFVLIVLPSFFRLGTYFSLDRSKFLCRTYLKSGKRSFFAYYGDKLKRKLYVKGKKIHNHNCVEPSFRARFDKCYLLESKEYKRFKLDTLNRSLNTAVKKKVLTPKQLEIVFRKKIIKNNLDKTEVELSKMLDVTGPRINQLKKEIKEEAQKVLVPQI